MPRKRVDKRRSQHYYVTKDELKYFDNSISRRDLQKALKEWGLPATGTTVELRWTYEHELRKRQTQENAVTTESTATATTATTDDAVPTAAVAAAAAATTASAAAATRKRAATDESSQVAAAKASNAKKPAAKKSPPTTATAAASGGEKRLKAFRKACPNNIRERIERAKSQRLYLIQRGEVEDHKCEFAVLGSTGNVYNVRISHQASCTCPDHARGHLCKHILFVLLKVMALDDESPLVYQAAWLTEELDEMFARLHMRWRGSGGDSQQQQQSQDNDGNVLANSKVRAAYAKLQSGEEDIDHPEEEEEKATTGVTRKSCDDDCPICFDSMANDPPSALTYCKAACGVNYHADCIRRWCQQQHRGSTPTCPNCRQPWESSAAPAAAAKGREGYTNLGTLQGQERARDESSYSGWYFAQQKRQRQR